MRYINKKIFVVIICKYFSDFNYDRNYIFILGNFLINFYESSAFFLVQCPAGTFKSNSSETCEKCPIGSYSKEAGSETCTSCLNSYMTTSVGSTEEESCKCILKN